jgi:hypothetical protein
MVNRLRKKKLLRQVATKERLHRMLALPAAGMSAPLFAIGGSRKTATVFGRYIFKKYRDFLSLLLMDIQLSPREQGWPELKFLLPYFFLSNDSAPNTIIKSVVRDIIHYKTISRKETGFSPLNLRQLQFDLLRQNPAPDYSDRPVSLAAPSGQGSFPVANLLQLTNDREESRKTFLFHTSPLAVQIFEKFPGTAAIPGGSEQKEAADPGSPGATQPALQAGLTETPGSLSAENFAGSAGLKLPGKPGAPLSPQGPMRNFSRSAFGKLAPVNIMARYGAGLKGRQSFIQSRGAAANLVNIEDRQLLNLSSGKSRSNVFFPVQEEDPYSGETPGLTYGVPVRGGRINEGPELQHLTPSNIPPVADAPVEETFTAERDSRHQSIQLARPADLAKLPASPSISSREINRVAEEVYTIIEKKLRIESERRGIFF